MKHLYLLPLLCGLLSAQQVRVSNSSTTPFTGYKQTTVDVLPPHPAGIVSFPSSPTDGSAPRTAVYVLGRQVGRDTWILDLELSLAAGEAVTLDLATSKAHDWIWPPIPLNDLPGHFGGFPELGGVPMALWDLRLDGAAIYSEWVSRTGLLFAHRAWFRWYPGQPGWCQGEIRITASNPSMPDVFDYIPNNFWFTFGDAKIYVPGRNSELPLIDSGTRFADGQSRTYPVTCVWERHLQDMQRSSMETVRDWKLHAEGIQNLLPNGNPLLPPNFNARLYGDSKLASSASVLHSWAPMIIGVNQASGDTGAQEDQTFVRGETQAVGGESSVTVAYFNALKFGNRPCHHLEATGLLLNPLGHTNPRLVLWDMRPHWSTPVSPDRLGKTVGISPQDAAGWWGADVEHALFNTALAGARLIGSSSCQLELDHIARNYLFQWTVQSGLSTSQPYASRAIGWEGILVVGLDRQLENRQTASLVRARWLARWNQIIGPWLNSPTVVGRGDVWDVRVDDMRMGPGARWSPWQQAVGAYGLDLAGEQIGPPAARQAARRGAEAVMRDGYVLVGGAALVDQPAWRTIAPSSEGFESENVYPLIEATLSADVESATAVAGPAVWKSKDVVALDGSPTTVGYFDLFGCPMAPAVVLRHNNQNVQARQVWTQLLQVTRLQDTAWLAPGINL